MFCVTRATAPFSSGCTISLVCLFKVYMEAFHVALHIFCQIQLWVSLDIPNPIPARSESSSIFLMGHLPLFLLLVPSLIVSEFSLELLAHPWRSSAAFVWFPTFQNGPFLSLEEVILPYQPSCLGSPSLQGCIPWEMEEACTCNSATKEQCPHNCMWSTLMQVSYCIGRKTFNRLGNIIPVSYMHLILGSKLEAGKTHYKYCVVD